MFEEKKDIIEVEVLDESIDESSAQEKAVRAVDPDAKRKVFLNIGRFLTRFALAFFFAFFAFAMTFSILYSQDASMLFLILLIVGWSLALLGALGYPLGFFFYHLATKEERR